MHDKYIIKMRNRESGWKSGRRSGEERSEKSVCKMNTKCNSRSNLPRGNYINLYFENVLFETWLEYFIFIC